MAQTIEATVQRVCATLRVWAFHMAARYNGPVYLTGSVLHNPVPRDIDLRIVVEDREFAARFDATIVEFDKPRPLGGRRDASVHYTKGVDWSTSGPTQRWVDDIAKTGAHLSVILAHNVDLQVWPRSYWREVVYPTPIELAAPSPKWHVYNAHMPDPYNGAPE